MESSQVSRLLEMAIAMSSAKEKATGNGKLDMAGIMAALVLAQKEEMTNKASWQVVNEGGQNSFLHRSYQKTMVKKTSTSSLVSTEYVSKTVSEETETNETVARKQSILQKADMLSKFEESKDVQETEKEKEETARSSLTGIQVFSKKSSENLRQGVQHLINRQDLVKEREGNIEKSANSSGSVIDTEMIGRKVAVYKEAIESMNSDTTSASSSSSTLLSSKSSSSLSSSSSGNSSPSYQKTSVNNANIQNNFPTAFLFSSHGIASLLTKKEHLNMENNAADEISEEKTSSFRHKNTTNTNIQMDGEQEKTNVLRGIKNIKAMFENKTDDEIREETAQKENEFKTSELSSFKNNAVNKKPQDLVNKAAIESTNTDISSTSSSSLSSSTSSSSLSSSLPWSSSAYGNSSPSYKNTYAVNNVHTNPPTHFLASSRGVESFLTMTKGQTMENNASEEKVTNDEICEENKRRYLQKNTTNKVKNKMKEKQEETNGLTGIKNIKALFENQTTDENKEETVYKEKKFNTSEYNSYTNYAMNNKPLDLENSLPDLLDSSNLQVSQFLAKVSELSAEKKKMSGNCKLDMGELAAALSSVTENSDKWDGKGSENKVVNNISSSVKNNKCNLLNQRNYQTLVSSSSSSSQENKKPEDERQIKKNQSGFCHSETVTSFSTKTQFSTQKSSFDSTPSNLANAKTCFLQSIISQSPAANNEQSKDDLSMNGSNDLKNSSAFIPEKGSVISELKNIINDDPTPIPNPPKR